MGTPGQSRECLQRPALPLCDLASSGRDRTFCARNRAGGHRRDIELDVKKTPAYTARTLKDRAVVQSQLAQAEAKLGASRAYLYEVFEEAWEEAVRGQTRHDETEGRDAARLDEWVLESGEAVDSRTPSWGPPDSAKNSRFRSISVTSTSSLNTDSSTRASWSRSGKSCWGWSPSGRSFRSKGYGTSRGVEA